MVTCSKKLRCSIHSQLYGVEELLHTEQFAGSGLIASKIRRDDPAPNLATSLTS